MAAAAASINKRLWMSESGPLSGTGGQDIAMFMAQNIIEDLKYMKVSAWIDWQSYAGGGDWETVRVDKSMMGIIPSKRCYMQAAFGRFIRPGSQIIECNNQNMIAALVPSTGNLVIIIRNGENSNINYTLDLSKIVKLPNSIHVSQYLVSSYKTLAKLPDIAISNKQFTLTVPPLSVTSCAIPGVVDSVKTSSKLLVSKAPSNNLAFSVLNKNAIAFTLPFAESYEITLYNGNGKKISNVCGQGIIGNNMVDLSKYNLATGLYFVQLQQRHSMVSGILRII